MRNTRIDAAKFVLMVLVVAGHLIEWLPLDSGQVVYRWIYMFHMPAFVFLSGLVCADVLDVRRARALVAFVVLPYLAHQLATNGMVSVLGNEPFSYQISNPYWALWYLVSLFCWRLLLPVMVATGAPVFVAICISLLSGLAPEFNHSWSIGRTASMLPFFVLGHLFAKGGGPRLPSAKPIAAVAMLFAIGAAAYLSRGVSLQWLWAHTPYEGFGVSPGQGLALRAAQLALGVIGSAAVFMLIPDSARLAALGRQSLAIFIGHIYVLKAMYAFGIIALMATLQLPVKVGAVSVLALFISVACAAGGRIFPWAFDFSWLLNIVDRIKSRAGTRAGARI
jgi:fucose 4-O-acetylase-like acetyltransferase